MQHADVLLAVSVMVVVALVAAWDIYAGAVQGATGSVSGIIQRWAVAYPILPFALGLVAGHLLWPVRGGSR
jgi:hypothetical protein